MTDYLKQSVSNGVITLTPVPENMMFMPRDEWEAMQARVKRLEEALEKTVRVTRVLARYCTVNSYCISGAYADLSGVMTDNETARRKLEPLLDNAVSLAESALKGEAKVEPTVVRTWKLSNGEFDCYRIENGVAYFRIPDPRCAWNRMPNQNELNAIFKWEKEGRLVETTPRPEEQQEKAGVRVFERLCDKAHFCYFPGGSRYISPQDDTSQNGKPCAWTADELMGLSHYFKVRELHGPELEKFCKEHGIGERKGWKLKQTGKLFHSDWFFPFERGGGVSKSNAGSVPVEQMECVG